MKVKLPEPQDTDNSKTPKQRDREIRKKDEKAKKKMKTYADKKRHAAESQIKVGDAVLARQRKVTKLTPYYKPTPMRVQNKKGSMMTASDGQKTLTRNASFFKKI